MRIRSHRQETRRRTRTAKLGLAASALVIALFATGCGGTAAPDESGQHSRVDTTVMRQIDHDYVPAESPEALVKTDRHDVIAAGEVETILQGDEIPMQAGDEQGEQFVLLKVRVTEAFRVRSANQITDGYAYVALWQGPRYNDPQGTPEFSLADWNRAIPAKTPVLLFLAATDEGMRSGLHGVPANAIPLAADVQGVIFEDGGRLLGGLEELEGQWTGIGSMKELTDRVRKQTK
ncbi:hypothetical protein E1218_16010 [Kribbella turkmenica]|uniref:Lipoprotein n=1 Tax=Kribbella turkmenica TaxID=2530375 RepID=A0A4R4X394_9ACTN|nr:hypothetical protein [Kribbella turkmenica]TDD24655.1 hypothetical protein E1218_16010 [Kribbella turkmenica]